AARSAAARPALAAWPAGAAGCWPRRPLSPSAVRWLGRRAVNVKVSPRATVRLDPFPPTWGWCRPTRPPATVGEIGKTTSEVLTLLAEFGTGQVFWSMVWFFLFFIWIWLLFTV